MAIESFRCFPKSTKHFPNCGLKPKEGSVHVISKHRNVSNFGTQLVRIIEAAGLTIWPKRWQNLRATQATELARVLPSHVVTAICGHTEKIAQEDYRIVTDDDIQSAASQTFAANMVQQRVTTDGNALNSESDAQKESPEKPGSAKPCTVMRKVPLEDRGLEPLTFWLPARRSPN